MSLSQANAAVEEYYRRILALEDAEALEEFRNTGWFYDPGELETYPEGTLAIAMHTLQNTYPSYYKAAEGENYVVFGGLAAKRWGSNQEFGGFRYKGFWVDAGFDGLRQVVAHEAGHTIRGNSYKWSQPLNAWRPIFVETIREKNANRHAHRYFPSSKPYD